jgi:hypothetical protein
MASESANSSLEEQQIRQIFSSLTEQAGALLAEVLRIEKEKLHMKNPIGVVDDIISNAKALIK